MKRSVKKSSKTAKNQSKRYKLIVLLFSTLIVAVVVWVMMQGKSLADFRSQAAVPKYNPNKCGDFKETQMECRGKPVGSLVYQKSYKVVGGTLQTQESNRVQSRCLKVGAKSIHSRSGTVLVPVCKFPETADRVSPILAKDGEIIAKILSQDTYNYESPSVTLVYGYRVPAQYALKKESFFNDMEVSYDTDCGRVKQGVLWNVKNYIFIKASKVLPRMTTIIKLPVEGEDINNRYGGKYGYSCTVSLRVDIDIPNNDDGSKSKISILDAEKTITINPGAGYIINNDGIPAQDSYEVE